MSQLSLRTPSGGTINIAPEDTAASKTLTLPADDSPLVSNESLLQTFNAEGSAPVYACRAWVNFSGQGTVAIRASGNVSSITDNGVGDYTVNFTTAMADADYSVEAMVWRDSGAGFAGWGAHGNHVTAPTVGAFRVNVGFQGTNSGDSPRVCFAIFR